MKHVKAFAAGFVSTLVFHQGVLALFWTLGMSPRAPYPIQAVPPFGVPQIVSLAFWGGVWGIAIAHFLRGTAGAAYWGRAILIGAVALTAVALAIVFPLKEMPFMAGWDPKIIVFGLILNGAWGLGLALFLRLSNRL